MFTAAVGGSKQSSTHKKSSLVYLSYADWLALSFRTYEGRVSDERGQMSHDYHQRFCSRYFSASSVSRIITFL